MAALFFALLLLSGTPEDIDLSQGSVNGKVALSFWAVEGFESRELLDPAGMEARLVPETDLDAELALPCGTWVAPPPGRYRFWLEGGGWISPGIEVLDYARSPFDGRGLASVQPSVPAGNVQLDPSVALPERSVLHLLHSESHNRGPWPHREMSRRLTAERAGDEVLMPLGAIVAALYDREAREYVALAGSLEVKPGEVVTIKLEPPAEGTDLLVVLARPSLAGSFEDYEVAVRATVHGREVRFPDELIPTAERVYALFFGLGGRAATVEAESGSLYLAPRDLPLRPRKVENLSASLQTKPSLTVRLDLPEGFESRETYLEVRSVPDWHMVLSREKVPAGAETFLLAHLPPEEVEIVLGAPPWTLNEVVDLSDGRDAELNFAPVVFTVRGTVYRGNEGHPARIRFQPPDMRFGHSDPGLEVSTDQAGRYEVTFLQEGHYRIGILLGGSGETPFPEQPERITASTGTLDFHLPGNRLEVEVLDAETGRGIPEAAVRVTNEHERGRSMTRAKTDGDGHAILPPLRPGKARILASAEGYENSPAEELTIGEDLGESTVVLSLEPRREGTGPVE